MADRTLRVEIIGDASSLNKAFGKAANAGDGLGKSLGKLAKVGIAAGVALGAGLAVGAKKSIDAASNLQEQINKTNVVFAKNGSEVLKWSKGLETSFGLSQRAALEAAGTFGNMLVPMGFARKEAASMSEQMVQLAGDMASFNNASPEETLNAIRAGLAGEAEPLRRYGVFLTAARIEQEALTETGKKSAKQLTEQEKATARYNLILKDTADTQGDFARSAGGSLANQIRIAQASFEDLAASIGSALLPVAIRVLGFINTKLIPGLGKVAGAVGDAIEGIKKGFKNAPDFRAKVNVVLANVKELAGKLVHEIISAVEGLLPQRAVVFNPRLEAKGLGTTGGGVDWNKVAEDLIAGLVIALETSVTLAKALADTITKAVDQIPWEDVGRKLGPGFATMLAAATAALLDVGFWIRNWDLALAIGLSVFKVKIPGFASNALKSALPAMERLGLDMIVAIANAINKQSQFLARAFVVVVAAAILAVRAAIVGSIRLLGNAVEGLFRKLGPLAGAVLKAGLIYAAINAIEALVQTLASQFTRVTAWLQGLRGKVIGALSNAGTWLYSAGVAIIQGLWDGVTSKAGGFLSYLGGLASKAKSIFTLGLHGSPELFTLYLGRDLMTQFSRGISEKASEAQKASYEAAQKVMEAAKQAVSEAQGTFSSAFDGLVSAALSAFDKVSQEFETKTERKIRTQDEARANADRQRAKREADAALDAARAAQSKLTPTEGESPEDFGARQVEAAKAVTEALRQQADAEFEIRRAKDEKIAVQERKQYDASRERQRVSFEQRLQSLEGQLERGQISVREFRRKVLALFENFDVPFRNAGKAIGAALAAGLHDSFGDAVAAARDLVETIARELRKTRFVVTVQAQGGGDRTPGRQHGGYVRRGMSYVVGEKRPEIFVPTQSGRIIPSVAGASGATADIHTHVYLDSTQIAEVVRREYLRFEKRNGRSAV